MSAPTTHSRLGPSSSSRWIVCPYSLRAPKTPAGPAAEEGTEAHGWGANVLLGNCSLADVPDKFAVGVALYVQSVRSNGITPIVERTLQSLEIDEFFGTIDCLLIQGDLAIVYDFKYGKWPVDATDNTQLLCYATLAAEHYDVTSFRGVIVQPRAFKGEKVKAAEFTEYQVEQHRERVKLAAVSDHKQAGEHCRFCSLRTTGACGEGLAFGEWKGWK
jgi:hypothetical protein